VSDVSTPVSFIRRDEKIAISPDFVKDFYFRSDQHLMVMLRVVGTDSARVKDFFKGREGKQFTVKTMDNLAGKQVSEEFLLASLYMDEGPPLSVDIDQELPLLRVILDFQKK